MYEIEKQYEKCLHLVTGFDNRSFVHYSNIPIHRLYYGTYIITPSSMQHISIVIGKF